MPRRQLRPVKEAAALAAESDGTSDAASSSSADSLPSADAAFIFNTTFSLHKASPLFIGDASLDPSRLQLLAGRLRDALVGDVVRGVELGQDGSDTALGSAGALEAVTIEWVAVDDVLDTRNAALRLSLQYESVTSTALLLPLPGSRPADGGFLHLPLLLLRMPVPLKSVVADFLSSTFDCRVSPLRLRSTSLAQSWERWIHDAGLPTTGLPARDVVLTLGFDLSRSGKAAVAASAEAAIADGAGINSIDIIIPDQELRRFLGAGQAQSDSNDAKWPFLDAVAQYLRRHLALDLSHPGVFITRIACGGFALSESRVKIFAASGEAARDGRFYAGVRGLLGGLVIQAKGS